MMTSRIWFLAFLPLGDARICEEWQLSCNGFVTLAAGP
jgi:hypothetical protein